MEREKPDRPKPEATGDRVLDSSNKVSN